MTLSVALQQNNPLNATQNREEPTPTFTGKLAGHLCTLGSLTMNAASLTAGFVAMVGLHNYSTACLIKSEDGRNFLASLAEKTPYLKIVKELNNAAHTIVSKVYDLHYGTDWTTVFGTTNKARALYDLSVGSEDLVIKACVVALATAVAAKVLSSAAHYFYGPSPRQA